jgi:hypothetical protein
VRGQPVLWPDVNLSALWLLNNRVHEIRRQRALLLMHLRRDPDFAITSPNWETFAAWEWRPDLRIGYLGDADWDRKWAPIAFSEWIVISLTVIYVNQNIFLLFYSTFENC